MRSLCCDPFVWCAGQEQADGRSETRFKHAGGAQDLHAFPKELLRALYPFPS